MKAIGFIGMAVFAATLVVMFFQLPEALRPVGWAWLFIGLPVGLLATAWHKQDAEVKKVELTSPSPARARAMQRRRMTPSRATELRVVDHAGTVGEGRYTIGRRNVT